MAIKDNNYDDLTERLLEIKRICDDLDYCTYDYPFCTDSGNGCAVYKAFKSTPNTWEIKE